VSWHRIASIEDAERAHPWLAADVGEVAVVLARLGDRWYAVEDRCTHAGCPFSEEATLEGGTIVCNCHGSEFDLATGALVRGPAERPVRAFSVRLQGDGLELEL
jgi:nitrite reductase/ring-hydroxylating ferredoxin subunit